MIDSFVNWLWPGQVDNIQPGQWEIVKNLNNTKNIVQSHQFRHKQTISSVGSSPRIAIGSSGQHALIGGTSNDETVFIQAINIGSQSTLENPSNNTIAYHEISWVDKSRSPTTQLCRLQFIPGGNDTYAATWENGVRIIDSNINQLITEYHPDHFSAYWSDWHPRDKHLIAIGCLSSLDLIDIRQRPAVRTDERLAIINAEYRYHGDCISTSCEMSCLWNPKDDNHLVTVCDGRIETYDRRTKRILHSKDYDIDMFDMQMTPNGKYLFAWGRNTHQLSQWKYDLDGVTFVRNIPMDVWELGTRRERYRDRYRVVQNLQYHVTDTHLFMPNKSTNWMPNESNTTAIQVFDVETGDKVKDIKAVKRGYNPTSDTNDYARVDAVVGLSNSHHEDQLYTLSDQCELGVWSSSEVSQEETEMQLLELERGSEELMDYYVPERKPRTRCPTCNRSRPADDPPNSGHQGAEQGANSSQNETEQKEEQSQTRVL